MSDSQVILHHYPSSPFSEKVRLAFGLKGLEWRSVVIPPVMPRPDLMPLSGGYRRTPILQIGADVFCDTAVIVRELERRFPEPTLFPGGSAGLCWMLAAWTDGPFFQASVASIFGRLDEGALPAGFLKDREQLSGRPFEPAAMRAAAPHAERRWRSFAWSVEQRLRAAGPFLLGEQPSYADITVAMNPWFLRGAHPEAKRLFGGLDALADWLARVVALGHGVRRDLSSAEALEIGRAASPSPPLAEGAVDCGFALGERVSVTPDDYGRIPVAGELVICTEERVAVRRHDEVAGEVVVHFPRLGFVLSRD